MNTADGNPPVLSQVVKQRLDQQVQDFLQEWLPKLDQPKQFRQLFDGLMQLGYREDSDSQSQSQQMLQRNLVKLRQQDLSQALQAHLLSLKKMNQTPQGQWVRIKKWLGQPDQPVDYAALEASFYQVLLYLDNQQNQLQKDQLFLQRDRQQLLKQGQEFAQYLYLTEQLIQHIHIAQLPYVTTLQQAKDEVLKYLTRKQQDILQHQQLNVQTIASMQILIHNNQNALHILSHVGQRIQPIMDALVQFQKQQQTNEHLGQQAEELKQAIAVYQQWLNEKNGVK